MTTNDDDELKRSNNQEENDNDNNSTKDGERLSALEALENKKEQQHYETSLLLVRSNSMKSLGEMNDMDQPLFNQSSGQLESNTQDQDNNKLETKARKDRLRRSMSLQLPGNNTGNIMKKI
ncbi:hypothetical protein BC941DRAFT_209125 [Chlamydoabsidia padenii]|nr:hypothetical protein BC941DRAFT_209125 [Chlamydoabsidia padenii]